MNYSLLFFWIYLGVLNASQEIYTDWLKNNLFKDHVITILNDIDKDHIFVVKTGSLQVFPKNNLEKQPEAIFTFNERLYDARRHKAYPNDPISGFKFSDYKGILLLRLKDEIESKYGHSSFVSFTEYDPVKKCLKVGVSNGDGLVQRYDSSEQYLQGVQEYWSTFSCVTNEGTQIMLDRSSTVREIIIDRQNSKFFKVMNHWFGIPTVFCEMRLQKQGDDANLDNFISPQFIETNTIARITNRSFLWYFLWHSLLLTLMIIAIPLDYCLKCLIFYTPLVFITPSSLHADVWYEGFFYGTKSYVVRNIKRKMS